MVSLKGSLGGNQRKKQKCGRGPEKGQCQIKGGKSFVLKRKPFIPCWFEWEASMTCSGRNLLCSVSGWSSVSVAMYVLCVQIFLTRILVSNLVQWPTFMVISPDDKARCTSDVLWFWSVECLVCSLYTFTHSLGMLCMPGVFMPRSSLLGGGQRNWWPT